MEDPKKQLAYALEKYPERVELAPIASLLMDSARQNDKRPAYVQLAVPDDVVKALRGGKRSEGDLLLLARVPREVLERSESRIVLPGEVG
jgi:hypothetical protein